jgi:hypothetical protein
VRNLEPFARFLQVAALMNAQVLNVENIARDCKVPRTTTDKYFDILIDFTVYGFVPLGIAIHMENLEVFKWVCILEITFFVNAAGLFFLSALIEKNQAAKVSFLGLLEKLR